jgi:hypothetical protein
MERTTDRKPTPGFRERSPGHYELRAYNAGTLKKIVRTYSTPARGMSREWGICEARKTHARLVSDIRAGKYGEKVTPDKIRTLGQPLHEWIDHGETRGQSPNTSHRYRVNPEGVSDAPQPVDNPVEYLFGLVVRECLTIFRT